MVAEVLSHNKHYHNFVEHNKVVVRIFHVKMMKDFTSKRLYVMLNWKILIIFILINYVFCFHHSGMSSIFVTKCNSNERAGSFSSGLQNKRSPKYPLY